MSGAEWNDCLKTPSKVPGNLPGLVLSVFFHMNPGISTSSPHPVKIGRLKYNNLHTGQLIKTPDPTRKPTPAPNAIPQTTLH